MKLVQISAVSIVTTDMNNRDENYNETLFQVDLSRNGHVDDGKRQTELSQNNQTLLLGTEKEQVVSSLFDDTKAMNVSITSTKSTGIWPVDMNVDKRSSFVHTVGLPSQYPSHSKTSSFASSSTFNEEIEEFELEQFRKHFSHEQSLSDSIGLPVVRSIYPSPSSHSVKDIGTTTPSCTNLIVDFDDLDDSDMLCSSWRSSTSSILTRRTPLISIDIPATPPQTCGSYSTETPKRGHRRIPIVVPTDESVIPTRVNRNRRRRNQALSSEDFEQDILQHLVL
jgi:hypothetical protein